MSTYICENCNNEITKNNYPKHGDLICWGSRNDSINYSNDPEYEIISSEDFKEKML